ncbi:MAG TPA: hypothetical protein VFJ24_08325 [Gaiellales bacterium]|nr:hypothetical protein [Gaiellales bacterium]
MSAPMVRAILDGRKFQTRRALKPQPPSLETVKKRAGIGFNLFDDGTEPGVWRVAGPVWAVREAPGPVQWRCPYGVPGDRLYVKEAIRRTECGAEFIADGSPTKADCWPWKNRALPSMYMPKGLRRITLEIADVRVERLHSITEDDARAEGIAGWPGNYEIEWPGAGGMKGCFSLARDAYRFLWCWINGDGSSSAWDANPWVWRIAFRRVAPRR